MTSLREEIEKNLAMLDDVKLKTDVSPEAEGSYVALVSILAIEEVLLGAEISYNEISEYRKRFDRAVERIAGINSYPY